MNCLTVPLEQKDFTPMSLAMLPCLHNWKWPQTSWTDQHQESGRYTCSSTENVAVTPKLRCLHQVLTWQGDVGCWCSLTIHPQSSRDTSRHHYQPCAHHSWQKNWGPHSHPRWLAHSLPCWNKHCRLARWYQWCYTCYMPIPWPQKHPNSGRWPCPLRLSSHHSSIRKEEDPPSNTWRTHGNQLVPKQS